jgi:hypothetical protein
MGKRHRRIRTICKRALMKAGLREDEFGELKTTKAYARQQFLWAWAKAEVDRLRERCIAEIQAEEDAVFRKLLEEAIQREQSP